jgi:hypothetical protein
MFFFLRESANNQIDPTHGQGIETKINASLALVFSIFPLIYSLIFLRKKNKQKVFHYSRRHLM